MNNIGVGLVAGVALALLILLINFLTVPAVWILVGFFAGLLGSYSPCKCADKKEQAL